MEQLIWAGVANCQAEKVKKYETAFTLRNPPDLAYRLAAMKPQSPSSALGGVRHLAHGHAMMISCRIGKADFEKRCVVASVEVGRV